MSSFSLRRWGFAIATLFIVLITMYFILLCGEFALAYLTTPKNKPQALIRAVKSRIIQEDIPQRKIAIKEGFKPIITPSNIVTNRKLRLLALEYNVAPLAPQPYSKLYFCNEGYGLIRYNSDRFGFRNPDDAWQKDADVILIGDSFVHGACVTDSETISAHLRDNFNVLNLGTIANNGIHYAALVERFLPVVRTRFVVLVFYTNDFGRGGPLSFYYLMHFVSKSNYFNPKSSTLALADEMKDFYRKAEQVITSQVLKTIEGEDLVRRFAPKNRYWSPQRFELKLIRGQIWEHSRKLFSDAKVPFGIKLAIDTALKHCRNKVCTPIVAFIPSSDVLQAKETTHDYSRILSRYASLNGLKFVDGTQALRSLGGDAYASEGGHLSPAGYKAVAQALAKGLGK